MNFRAPNSQRKAEIVIVTPGYTSSEGGAARAVAELTAIISRRAPVHFTWVAHGGREQPNVTGSASTLLPMRGWGIFEKLSGMDWLFWNRPSRAALRQAIFRADMIWIHDTLYPGARVAFQLARRMGRPVLATQHESLAFAASHGVFMRRLWARLIDRLFTVPLLRRARQVTFTSNAAARFYDRRVHFAMPPHVIPNGVDGQVFHPPSADDYRNMRTRFALRDDQPVLLFVGRFDDAVSMSVIRHVAELLPNWRFWLAGHGRVRPESWYLPNVQVFRGRSGGALAELYQAADLLMLPGVDSESPHILYQALVCQLPVMCNPAVVAGHSGAARCLVVNVDPSSPRETAKQWVQKLTAGKDVWPQPPEQGTPFDLSWDWLQVAAHYMEIVQSLCQPQTAATPSPRNDVAAHSLPKTAG